MNPAQLEVTLGLLTGPSKAVVSSALSVSAAYLSYTTTTPAQCSPWRQPYDDVVFNKEFASSVPTTSFAALYKPRRPVGREAFRRLVTPKNLTITGARNVGLSCLLVVNRYIAELQEAEEQAMVLDKEPIYPPFPRDELMQGAKRGGINSCLDWSTQCIRSILDWLATQHLSTDLSNKLRKELRLSVVRKASKYPWYIRGARVIKTSLYSEASLYAADWIVACMVECYNMFNATLTNSKTKVRLLVKRCGLHSVRCSLVLLAVSVGNGVGSMSPAKRGLAMFACGQVASFFINTYMHGVIAKCSVDDPPPAAPPVDFGAQLVEAVVEDQQHQQEDNDDEPAAPPAPEQQQQQPPAAAAVVEEVQEPVPPAEPVPQERRVPLGGPRLPQRNRRRPGGIASPATPSAPTETRGVFTKEIS